MPRKKRDFGEPPRLPVGSLVGRLADELRINRESGQPFVDELRFPSGKIRANVIWDAWDRLPLEDRTATILRAYELAEGRDYSARIALASGLTVPEAHAAGMVPFQILAALRKGDPVTAEQCRQAMLEEGASTLFVQGTPQLLFATAEETEACRKRLIRRLSGSEEVWVIAQEAGRAADPAPMDVS